MTDCLFCRIVAGEIPATVVHDSAEVLAFRDINPAAPTHVLVIPKAHHTDVAELAATDPALAGRVLDVCAAVARAEGVDGSGYRVVFNSGPDSGQVVHHVHAHVLGGRHLGPLLAR